jgi:acid phosphatase type 7
LMVVNDPIVNRHSAVLRDLEPDTTYVYSVGSGDRDHWSEEAEFTTAPDGVKPFTFMYMGDAQNGLDRWGTLLKNTHRLRPDASFYIMAGDLVNRGADRDDWDSLFYNSAGVYDRRTLVPVIGNHECQGGHPTLYLKQFNVMTNGPADIEKERAYSFEYSNALFVILDSNLPARTQTNWLERVLSNSKATWKFVTYHHPAYSSGKARDNKSVRDLWTPIFDKYHVDLALQGHDHAYLRTYPMKDQKKVKSAADGTLYIVSASGTKFYDQGKFDYTEVGFTNVATIQAIDIQISGDRLVYKAHDIDGKVRDEFVIEKKARRTN